MKLISRRYNLISFGPHALDDFFILLETSLRPFEQYEFIVVVVIKLHVMYTGVSQNNF